MSKYETIFLIALMITGSFTTWCLTREKPDKADNAALAAEVEQLSQKMESLIGNGYPINVCSSQGFAKQRDSEGVCRPVTRSNRVFRRR